MGGSGRAPEVDSPVVFVVGIQRQPDTRFRLASFQSTAVWVSDDIDLMQGSKIGKIDKHHAKSEYNHQDKRNQPNSAASNNLNQPVPIQILSSHQVAVGSLKIGIVTNGTPQSQATATGSLLFEQDRKLHEDMHKT